MRSRRGQIALYLVAIVVAITAIVVMNVSVFLSVRSKNRAMHAGDAAAIAVAKYQGELLNRIGELNVEHLKAAIEGDERKCEELMDKQRRLCFISPLDGIRIGNEAAMRNGVDGHAGDGMAKILREHVLDVRTVYSENVDVFPEPWPGAWSEYADALEALVGSLGDDMVVGPDNAEFADALRSFPLADKMFYEAIAGRDWCWFLFNGEWLFDRDSRSMPRPEMSPQEARDNSEIYPLHLKFEPLPDVADPKMIRLLTELGQCATDELAVASRLLGDPHQQWAFYDEMWHPWREIDPRGEEGFPAMGSVRPEYNVLGCAAICRVETGFTDLVDNRSGVVEWTAAAKPFGVVENLDGDIAPVTALERLVLPAFSDVRLVPVDAVGGADLSSADYDWVVHLKKHLPGYFEYGPHTVGAGCFYCDQLRLWEKSSFRAEGRRWLRHNSGMCIRPAGGWGGSGGAPHGH